ncbi:hypothetical protein BH11PSE4_BH11PSE4_26300 [soil metagenome]
MENIAADISSNGKDILGKLPPNLYFFAFVVGNRCILPV